MRVQKLTDNTCSHSEAVTARLNHDSWDMSQCSVKNSAAEPELPTGSGHRSHKILEMGSPAGKLCKHD